MQVDLADSAVDDLRSILEWYQQEQVPEVGVRLVDEILNRLDQIAEHPKSGRIVPEFQQPELRELIHEPFRMVYLVEKNRCSVVRVWRSESITALTLNSVLSPHTKPEPSHILPNCHQQN